MTLIYTPVYAALLALLYVVLSIRVIKLRRKNQVALGDAGNPDIQRAIRVHANFAEYVPLALILITFVEIQNFPAWIVNLLGLALLCGRSLHAYGVSQTQEKFKFRIAGMALTFTCIISAALMLLTSWL